MIQTVLKKVEHRGQVALIKIVYKDGIKISQNIVEVKLIK